MYIYIHTYIHTYIYIYIYIYYNCYYSTVTEWAQYPTQLANGPILEDPKASMLDTRPELVNLGESFRGSGLGVERFKVSGLRFRVLGCRFSGLLGV